VFLSSKDCDITQNESLKIAFEKHKPEFVINAAAYTQVDLAEEEKDKAYAINAEAVENIAKLCNQFSSKLIHISTDYVFNGEAKQAYTEEDTTNPINIYGASKLAGEEAIKKQLQEHYIIRTSWLYSQFGHNFFKSMKNKVGSGATLKITTDQMGCPTNANDLASIIMKIISLNNDAFGTYHFCNQGKATWYDFAYAIFKNENALSSVNLSSTDFYKTPAKRPVFSVMQTDKISSTFSFEINEWEKSLLDLQKSL
jgi:dTDP-4-dehydrorhamnose reductase